MQLKGNRWFTLLITSLGFLMILIDTTIVNVSIPTIVRDLGATLADIEWVISGYALTFAAFLITFGRLGDMYGRKKFFILGMLVFILSSAFAGEARSPEILIIARLFQGIGGAMISPSTLSLISSTFRGRERAIAFGIWGAVAGVAVAIGPILGGYFTTYQTWRWIFRVNIPVGLLAILAAWYFIAESKEDRKQKLDLSGMATSAIGFFFLVFALIEGQTYGWLSPIKNFSALGYTWANQHISIIPIALELALIFLTVFLAIEYYKTVKRLDPAININFFNFKSYRYGLVAIAVISLGEFSSLFTLPVFLQSIKGFSPIKSGAAVLPLALATFISAPLSARLVNKIGTKWVITGGVTLEFVGLFWLSFLKTDLTYPHLIGPLILLGAGIGLAISQNTQVILSEIPPQESGSASGVLNTLRQIGSALGIAIVGAVLASRLTVNLTDKINAIPTLPVQVKQSIIDKAGASSIQINSDNTVFQPQIPDGIQNNPAALEQFRQSELTTANKVDSAIKTSLTNSISTSMRVGSLFVLLGALLSLLIPNVKPHPQEPEQTTPIH